MQPYFSIREAAKMVDLTSETLRHYDRIALCPPSKRDEWTGYRYYSKQDIVRLNTIKALRCMDLSLEEIRQVLEFDDLEKIIAFLKRAEQNADEKIAKLQYAKSKIQLARQDYEKKWKHGQPTNRIFVQPMEQRVILLSKTMEAPSVDHLWRYHSHFYDEIAPSLRAQFTFEDLAGIYTRQGRSQLFAVCVRHPPIDGLRILPAGNYLCANATQENRAVKKQQLLQAAKQDYGVDPPFVVEMIVVTGILQWNYQIQIFIDPR